MSDSQYDAHVAHTLFLGLPFVQPGTAKGKRLAVVGGGPSIKQTASKLHQYDEVWGINNAAQWVKRHTGIDAALYTVDGADDITVCEDVERAVLSTGVHPNVFAALCGKDVRVFHTNPAPGSDFVAHGGCSSACRVPLVALHMGYTEIAFFGCEGSYGETSHVYPVEERKVLLVVRADGKDYVTQPDFYMQCEYLAQLIHDYPEVFKDESGGLLGAMGADPEWEVVAISDQLADVLTNGQKDKLPTFEVSRAKEG